MRIRPFHLAALLLAPALDARAEVVTIGFEDVGQGLAPGSFYNGSDGAGGFTSQGAFFNNNFRPDPLFPSWTGWAYSNASDTSTPGFTNQYSAFASPPGGSGSATYGVAFLSRPDNPGLPTDIYDFPYIDLPSLSAPVQSVSARIANTTYAALSMRDGDAFAKKFGGATGDDPDYLLLRITGYSGLGKSGPVTGSLDVYLADYRSSDNRLDYVLDDWTDFDLTPLVGAAAPRSLGFQMFSSDVGDFGIRTPTYFALDNLGLVTAAAVAVPEPSGLALLGLGASCLAYRLCRRGRAA